ncbi:filamentous hemagglutinin N-terminal domain-containing protein [Ramlibacter terrae]|uniref:Filamentous hemagglutinin N-terminal domain-containing protein n=1 Tax=Ramlibacter terrae TaxID=2732511 RepID=A0ABX6P8B7_9BURK|nr:filamentous hemagglutinin N-terminal domain-containing protein [Ramlibacter terrae]
MSGISTKAARDFARVVASSPAVAGFRPGGAALAVAAAFGLQPVTSQAQPSGAQVIHGQAQIVRNGNNVVITTRNGAGTNHSAIDWQSFSVPGGSITRFNQPSASSTSINRVVGDNPSEIFGTLRSNGRLVLVNPAGIAVGKGAPGRHRRLHRLHPRDERRRCAGRSPAVRRRRRRPAGQGPHPGAQGRCRADRAERLHRLRAVIESNGATVLAAGEKVEITGRGLEGIHLEVQAPNNAAVNLGRLEGDAVGIFAGTLTHSGKVAARAVAGEGGKVILQALGDNIVSGRIEANGGNRGRAAASTCWASAWA